MLVEELVNPCFEEETIVWICAGNIILILPWHGMTCDKQLFDIHSRQGAGATPQFHLILSVPILPNTPLYLPNSLCTIARELVPNSFKSRKDFIL